MIQINDLEKLVSKYAQIFKSNYSVVDGKICIKKNVNFHDTYLIGVEYRDRVATHAEVGEFPDRLFIERAPNQTDKEFNYIKKNYKQNTLPVYTDYHSTISRAWSDGNWSVDFKESKDDENSLEKYLESEIKLFGSLENYYKMLVTHLRNVDPNGVIAVRPLYIPETLDGSGNIIIDTSVRLSPQPIFYRCDQVIYRDTEKGYLILTDETSEVEYISKKMNMGLVMEYYDENVVYVIKQTGKLVDWTFTIETFFVHNEGIIPISELKAVPKLVKRNIVYMPEFLYACDNLDLTLMNAQYLQCSIALVCFPYRVMVGGECTYSELDDSNGQYNTCVKGWINKITDEGHSRHICPSCLGSGLKDRVSQVGGVLLLSKEDWSSSGDKSFADKAMYYVSPETNALEFTKVKIIEDIESARRIMHLQTSTTEVKANPSGTATGQVMDEKAKDAFTKPISDSLFTSFEFVINRIGYQRYADSFEKPVVIFPNTFGYNTESDYLRQISEAISSGLPPFVIETIFLKYLKTLYYNEQKTADVFRLIVKADRLLIMPSKDAELKLSKGTVEKWEIVLHDSALMFISELEIMQPDLFELDIDKQVELLQNKAKEVAASIVSQSQSQQNNLITSIIG